MRTRYWTLALLMALATGHTVEAAQTEWTKYSGGPYGASINYLEFPLNDSKVIYSGLDAIDDSSYVYRSTDVGATWTRLGAKGVARAIPNKSCELLVFNGSADSVASGVLKSTTCGDTWTSVSGFSFVGDVEVMADGSTIYATKEELANFGVAYKLYRSSDQGKTWVNVSSVGGDPTPAALRGDSQLEVDRRSGTLFSQLPTGKVLKSTSGGAQWLSASQGLTLKKGVWSLTLDQANPQVLYSVGPTGVYQSRNAASTWTRVNFGCSDCTPISISIRPQDSRTLYLASKGTQQASVSTDGGSTWSTMDIPRQLGLPLVKIVGSPTALNVILAGGISRGIFRSNDSGKSWRLSSNGLVMDVFEISPDPRQGNSFAAAAHPVDEGFPYPAANLAFFKSMTQMWSYKTILGMVNPSHVARAKSNPDIQVLLGDRLAVSTDNGVNWLVRQPTPASDGTEQQLRLSITGQTIFIKGATIYKSRDFGGSWAKASPPPASADDWVPSFAIDPTDEKIMIAVLQDVEAFRPDRLLKTVDGGLHWSPMQVPDGVRTITHVEIHPLNRKFVFLMTYNGLFKSENGGAAWNNIAPGFRDEKLTFDTRNVNRMLAYSDAIWKTVDGGKTWQDLPVKGLHRFIKQLVISPWNKSVIYAAGGDGIYFLTGQ